jgi:hypothetical protein
MATRLHEQQPVRPWERWPSQTHPINLPPDVTAWSLACATGYRKGPPACTAIAATTSTGAWSGARTSSRTSPIVVLRTGPPWACATGSSNELSPCCTGIARQGDGDHSGGGGCPAEVGVTLDA